jgi:hypothetical protein
VFTASESDVVSIDMRVDNPIDNVGALELRRPNEELLRDVAGNAEDGNASIALYELPRIAGEYIIDVTSADYSDAATVSFEVSLYKGIPPAGSIGYGESRTGDLTRESRYLDSLPFDGYHDTYGLQASEGDKITVEMRPDNPVDNTAQLTLFDPDGTEVRERSGNGEDGNTVITQYSVDEFQDGEYSIVATGTNETDLFSYELFAYEGIPIDQSLSFGESQTASITDTDRYYDDVAVDGYHHTYGLQASEGDKITIEMRPDNPVDNTASLVLFDPDGTEVEERSSNGEDGNAVITQYLVDESQGGEYTIVATGSGRTDQFSYEISAYEGLPIDQSIAYGESQTAEITDAARYYDDVAVDGYHHTYGLQASAGDEITIEMRPDNPVDNTASLVLFDPDGTEVRERSANGEDGNAVITQYLVDEFQGGEYTVVATGNSRTDQFSYELFAYEGLPIDQSIAFGESQTASITDADRYYDDASVDGYHHTYGVDVLADNTFTVELRLSEPTEYTGKLVLYDPDGTLVWDSSGNGTDGNAVIQEYSPDQAGTFTIVATGARRNDLFSYTISLSLASGTRPDTIHPSGVSLEVWEAVTAQTSPTDSLTSADLDGAVLAYQNNNTVGGVELTFQDLIDLVQWFNQQ